MEILATQLGFGIERKVSGLTWFSPLTHITLFALRCVALRCLVARIQRRVQVQNNEINGTKTGSFYLKLSLNGAFRNGLLSLSLFRLQSQKRT